MVPSLLLVCQQYAGKNPEIYCTELRQGTLILNCYDHPGALVVVSSLHSSLWTHRWLWLGPTVQCGIYLGCPNKFFWICAKYMLSRWCGCSFLTGCLFTEYLYQCLCLYLCFYRCLVRTAFAGWLVTGPVEYSGAQEVINSCQATQDKYIHHNKQTNIQTNLE